MTLIKMFHSNSSKYLILAALTFLVVSLENEALAKANQTLKASEIEHRALEFLVDQNPWDPELTEITVEYKGKDILLPSGNYELSFRLPGNVMRTGRFALNASVMVGKAIKKRIRMEAEVTRSTKVIRASRPIARGEILTEEDVALEIIKSNRSFRGVATRIKDVVGFEAVRNLVEGREIRINSLRKAAMVKKGDQVTLVAESGPMKITAPGIAREKGFKDSLVQVLNLQTKKTVFGQVVDSQTIKVNF